MARNRIVKADFWTDEKVGKLSHLARLLFVGTWNFADDSGVCRANPIYLKNQIFPYDDVDVKNIHGALTELSVSALVVLFEHEKESYLWIRNFEKHQVINRPSKFRYIKELDTDSLDTHGTLSERSRTKVKVKVKVKENEKARACAREATGEDTPLKSAVDKILEDINNNPEPGGDITENPRPEEIAAFKDRFLQAFDCTPTPLDQAFLNMIAKPKKCIRENWTLKFQEKWITVLNMALEEMILKKKETKILDPIKFFTGGVIGKGHGEYLLESAWERRRAR